MQELYRNENKNISDDDFLAALMAIGINEGDILFVHSDISAFGRIAEEGKGKFLSALVGVLQKSVGTRGTIVMPTFTYSFCKHEVFDRAHTKSAVGALTEFFRTQPGVVRSTHPLFSVAAWGAHRENFLRNGKDSFGEGTVFGTLRTLGGKNVFFGVPLQTSCTFSHHLEQTAKVPYRFIKTFTGTIIDGSRQYEDSYTYFVRPLDGTITLSLGRFEEHLRKKGLLKETRVGNGVIGSVNVRDLFEEGMQLLAADPYYLVERGSEKQAQTDFTD